MEEDERNPFANEDGNPQEGKTGEWAEWEEIHQTYRTGDPAKIYLALTD